MSKYNKSIRKKTKIAVKDYNNEYVNNDAVKMKLKKSISREMKLSIISAFLISIVMLSGSYAIFSSTQKAENFNTLTVGTLTIDFNDTDSGLGNIINLNGAYPESDEDGLKETPYTFKITNTGNVDADYTVKVADDTEMISKDGCSNNLLDKSDIKISIDGETPVLLSDTESNSYTITTGTLKAGENKTHLVRIWLKDSAGNEVLNKHYHGKIIIESQNKSTT